MKTNSQAEQEKSAAAAGLCATCSHGKQQLTKRGSQFWRCLLSDANPQFPRYPALPVGQCDGFEAAKKGFQEAN